MGISCLNFWDEAWWFLSVRVFGLLSSSLLFYFHNVSAAVSSGLPQVSLVYLGTEMIQPGKLFLKFDNKDNSIYFYKPVSKRQSMKWKHSDFPVKKSSCYIDSLLGHNCRDWFPGKRYNCNQWFLLPALKAKFYYIYWLTLLYIQNCVYQLSTFFGHK